MTNYSFVEGVSVPIKIWDKGVLVEDKAVQQLKNISGLPFIHSHVAAMSDCHWGLGATVGSVIPTIGAIIPAAVGVDIGCGMMAVRTSITASMLPDNLSDVRSRIEALVPHGRSDNGGRNDIGAHQDSPPVEAAVAWAELFKDYKEIVEKHPKANHERGLGHLGTLGTGNHFIELCLDTQGYLWVMLHSGSRGIGNKLGTYFIELAKKDMERWFINLPDKDLAYFPQGSEFFGDYLKAVNWGQKYAKANREVMMGQVLKVLRTKFGTVFETEHAINCHHNYVSKERHFGKDVWLTRKGAVKAGEGDLGIIPGSMGQKSYIVRGKGNRDSFCSCSHGAGRAMSRGEAKKRFTLEDHIKATEGVDCRKDEDVLDETPMAYKDIDLVMEAQKDLVEIVHTLKQIVCVKG